MIVEYNLEYELSLLQLLHSKYWLNSSFNVPLTYLFKFIVALLNSKFALTLMQTETIYDQFTFFIQIVHFRLFKIWSYLKTLTLMLIHQASYQKETV